LSVDAFILKTGAEIFTTLPSMSFLRSSDCIHLVTAVHLNCGEFLTFDAHQTGAAAALGLIPVTA
jgi:predicted nucleic acid-binding protein